MDLSQTEDELGRLIFDELPFKAFWRRYLSEVDSATKDLRESLRKTPRRVRLTEWFYLPNDYILVRTRNKKLSLYETPEKTAYNKHINDWASFARGAWTSRVPTKAGTYPVRDKQGARGIDRVIIEFEDRLVDISGGYVPPNKVTSWVGDWWTEPFPELPGAI